MKTKLAGFCLLSLVALAGGFAQAPAQPPAKGSGGGDQPTTMDTHPPAGHPVVLKPSTDWPQPKAADVATPEAIVAAYYAAGSGASGQPRDWDRFRSLFHPAARLIPARPTGDGGAGAFFLGVDDYIEQNKKYFEKSGFIDRESARRVESFGNVTHVWSTYESRRKEADPEPYARGIASIQLLKDSGRWWIVNIFWDYEREGNLVPQKYLATPKE